MKARYRVRFTVIVTTEGGPKDAIAQARESVYAVNEKLGVLTEVEEDRKPS